MKQFLHLDKTFTPSDKSTWLAYEAFTFSGGEPHIKISPTKEAPDHVVITHRVTSFNDIGLLLVATNALKAMGTSTIELVLPYFPGGRQDRLMVVGEALTVKVYADIINAQQYNKVTVLDPHSEVTPALINNCVTIDNHNFIKAIASTLSKDLYLVSPDGGALKKIYKLAAHLQDYEVIECSKSRDVKTGKLSGFKVYADDLQGKDCLIVDDICDGGGTFVGLAKELKKKNAGKLYLAVTHGIFSKGLDHLTKIFDGIFTTDAFKTIENTDKVTQLTTKNI